MYWSENIMSNVTFLMLLLILMSSSQVSTSQPLAKQQDNIIPSFRLSPSSNGEMSSSLSQSPPSSSSSSLGSPLMKSRWVRDIHEGVNEDDLPLFNQDYSLSPPQHHQQSLSQSPQPSSKAKGMYPPLTGSGELFRLFRPLALSPERTIGMTKWYLPGFGYFSRGGRASSNFIRFGRSGNGNPRFVEEEDDNTPFSRNYAKKKNNFIRLGRENPRQTNFIRLGRSGGATGSDHAATAVGGEYYNSGYITSALSDPLRSSTAGGEVDDNTRVDFN